MRHVSQFGKRSVNGSLTLGYRSTQGGRQTITLPASLRVTQVTADGEPVPVRPDKGQLSLSLLPGEHSIDIQGRRRAVRGSRPRPDRIDLGSPASNITTTVMLAQDRWPLFVHGPGIGTTVLYWGELAIFALLAFGLSLVPKSPLRFRHWLLLGLGLSTLSWLVFAGVRCGCWPCAGAKTGTTPQCQAGPSTLRSWRWQPSPSSPCPAWCSPAYAMACWPHPDMGIAGPGGYGAFEWFVDRSQSLLPEPVVISVRSGSTAC